MAIVERHRTPHEGFERDLAKALRDITRRDAVCYIPQQDVVNRRLPGSQFHDTPEIFFQIGGASEFECPKETFRLLPGTTCVMPRGVPHAETPQDTRTVYEIVVAMEGTEGMFLQRARADRNNQIQAIETLFVSGADAKENFRILDEISAHLTISRAHRRAYILRLAEVFLIRALSQLQRTERAGGNTAGSRLIVGMENLVRTRLSDSALTMASIATVLGCSPDHLTRRFRRERGINPKEWIARQRVTRAIDLLSDYRHNISEVAWACGFKEASYFIKVFKTLTGITPRAFRARLAEENASNAGRGGPLRRRKARGG